MKMTFRWYGEGRDPISLKKIKQIPGMSGLMGVLDEKAAGEVWTYEECKAYVDHIHEAGLECEVIESVNVHEDIKMGLPTRDQYIANYCETIRNLAKVGVKVIIYNFMPVFDWLRTDLAREIPEDGSNFSQSLWESFYPASYLEDYTAKNSPVSFYVISGDADTTVDISEVQNFYDQLITVAPDAQLSVEPEGIHAWTFWEPATTKALEFAGSVLLGQE